MTRSRRWVTGMSLVLAGLGAGLSGGAASAATSCGAITIAQGQGLNFDVSSVLVTTGGCVRFANLTSVTVTVRVSGSSFSARLPAKTPASASPSFTATKAATVTATDGIRTGHGTISVEAPPPTPESSPTFIPPPVTITPTPPTHSPSPPPSSSPSPLATPTHSATPSPTPSPTHTDSAISTLPTLPSLPSGGGGVAAPPEANHPVVAPQVHRPGQLASTVIEPVGGPRRGLPAAVAATVVLGLATAFGRAVLAAVPAVDRRRRYVGRSL